MARKRNEEYKGDNEDEEFEEEPVEEFEDPDDFVDDVNDEGMKKNCQHIQKCD
jgi:hypothetical protein